ncbi:MAG TPA: MarR family transcriptional regulator [Mycobacteriales bacterium]|nr:MarR family transcriptional regulator [Mycobacteriales bacterium]
MGEPLDRMDLYLAQWQRARPDLDISSMAVVGRLRRVTAFADRELDATLAGFGLSRPAFELLDALRRLGRPNQLRQSELLAELDHTSGTLSVRLARLEATGLVSRRPDPTDRRGVVVELTAAGSDLVDRVLPAQAATERAILEPLDPAARRALTGMLRVLLVGCEMSADAERTAALLGVVLVRPEQARRLRRSVGLAERPGVLVAQVSPDGPAARAGIGRGDLLVAARTGTAPTVGLHDLTDLGRSLAAAGRRIVFTVLRGTRQRRVTVHL